jgi:hypothetical protein
MRSVNSFPVVGSAVAKLSLAALLVFVKASVAVAWDEVGVASAGMASLEEIGAEILNGPVGPVVGWVRVSVPEPVGPCLDFRPVDEVAEVATWPAFSMWWTLSTFGNFDKTVFRPRCRCPLQFQSNHGLSVPLHFPVSGQDLEDEQPFPVFRFVWNCKAPEIVGPEVS